MDIVNQYNVNTKISVLIENLNELLDKTLNRSHIYMMSEKLNFIKMTQTQYHSLIFEQELFDILLKNKYAVANENSNDTSSLTTGSAPSYHNTDYPFTLIICSRDAHRASILVNNVGLVLVKFVLYLRMLNQNIGRPDCPNCFLAVNMKTLPFGRICIDVDYKLATTTTTDDEGDDRDSYERFVERCFQIVGELTTAGNIIMTRNCFTPNTRSFHLITEQQFDATTRQVLFVRMAERIQQLNRHVKIDQVHVWMLPFGRGHTPVRKYTRKTNEFSDLAYPYTEVDFELAMPFDLSQGTDNLYTLYTADGGGGAGCDDDDSKYDILYEYPTSENGTGTSVHTYRIASTSLDDVAGSLQLFVKMVAAKYEFAFRGQMQCRYEHNYLSQVFGHKYNCYFIIMSNKKLLFENNWQVPKPKVKQRPTEPYEIYRFISARLLNGLTTMEDLFRRMPDNLVRRNVNIGNVDELQNDEIKNKVAAAAASASRVRVKKKFTDSLVAFNMDAMTPVADTSETSREVHRPSARHPWPYVIDGRARVTGIASVDTKNTFDFFHRALPGNVYPYERANDDIMDFFANIQSMLSANDRLLLNTQTICHSILTSDTQKIQNYLFPLYEFFCRVHYIDSCVTSDEYMLLQDEYLAFALPMLLSENELEAYRAKYVEMTPGANAYRIFPQPNTPLANIWQQLLPAEKILLHIIYLMAVEHNYSSVFFHLHNVLKMTNSTQIVCSFMLNILDVSSSSSDDGSATPVYASREFLNFIYATFIDGGPNFECDIRNDNVYFNMINLQAYISDMQVMFVASPFWFFLANFQYVDENMDCMQRLELFTHIFRQEAMGTPTTASGGSYVNAALASLSSAVDNGGGPTPAKQMKTSGGGNSKGGGGSNSGVTLNHDKCFKMCNIGEAHHVDLLTIIYRYILGFCRTENGEYVYEGAHLSQKPITPPACVKALMVRDPVKYSNIYRHQYGIYNTWTMQMERHTSMLYTQITISNDEFAKYPHLFNAYNDAVYRVMVNRFLKSITFTRVLNCQKNLGLLLAPIYDPNVETNIKVLNYNIDSIQINIHDLSSSDFVLPPEMFVDILRTNNRLYKMFKWLYCILCHYSESYSCIITTPSSFIPKCMVDECTASGGGVGDNGGSDIYASMLSREAAAHSTDANRGDRFIQRIHKVLETKKREQRENITDELQKLSQRELTSLILLFDNTFACTDDDDGGGGDDDDGEMAPVESDTQMVVSSSSSTEDICRFNLSARGGTHGSGAGLDFFESDEFTENSKNKLLMGLFNRKLSPEIVQMSLENFEKTIEDNHSQHIVKFVMLILSWFVRTLHTHPFSETVFFREIQQHRQRLYDELSDLVFRHNGYFIYNDRITDVATLFSCYCRNVELVVDPVFAMTMTVDPHLYLGYDATIEQHVSSETIKDIEDGCVSAIYQGQFIEDTNVDLNRLWARVTVPRNKHRISPLFSLHTATGKSEYLTERCRRHFNNKYHNNFLDSTSLKTGDHRGTDMARELNANLIVCIEEFSNLSEKFKQICGHTAITYKPLWADTKICFQNNATVILSTNNDPKCTEEAVIARLHVYPRRIQYANVNKYMKFQRSTMCASTSLLKINNIMTVQMIMEKMPRVVAENYRGNFMMTWLLKRFFLFNVLDPVTVHTSETLQNHNNNFHNMINAQEIVLERLELNTSSAMSLFEFRKLVNRICEENRTLFNSKVDTYNVFTILSDKLKTMIDNDAQTIRVCEKNYK